MAVPIRFAQRAGGPKHAVISSSGATYLFEPSIGFVADKLFELSAKLRSFKVPLEQSVRSVMAPSIRQNFQSEGRPTWEPLAKSTLERRTALHQGARILHVKGKLEDWASRPSIWEIGMTTAVIRGQKLSEKVPYAAVHQAGSKGSAKTTKRVKLAGTNRFIEVTDHDEGKGGVIPARPFLMIHPEDMEKIYKIFEIWLDQKIGTTWRAGI